MTHAQHQEQELVVWPAAKQQQQVLQVAACWLRVGWASMCLRTFTTCLLSQSWRRTDVVTLQEAGCFGWRLWFLEVPEL